MSLFFRILIKSEDTGETVFDDDIKPVPEQVVYRISFPVKPGNNYTGTFVTHSGLLQSETVHQTIITSRFAF